MLPAVCTANFEGCDQWHLPDRSDLLTAEINLVRKFDVVATMEDLESFRQDLVQRWAYGWA